MIILGIDPGTASVGYGAIKVIGKELEYVTSGIIQTDKKKKVEERLREIQRDFMSLLQLTEADVVVIEKLFFFNNAKSCIEVAQARGVILAECIGVEVHEYTPQQMKLAVAGHGRADKNDIRKAVKRILEVDIKDDNSADGIALAICHTRLVIGELAGVSR